VARPELGTKRVCPTTGRKFYDLNRDPIVSPYTGESLPRASFDPPPSLRGGARGRAVPEDEEASVVPAGPETVSLEEVGAAEEESADVAEDEAVLAEEGGADDTFLEEEEEEEGGDVAALIDGDLEDDEES
jgi:uncharacterized protein (TIGR02300 family)